MLQSIRDYTQGWIAGIVISLIILSFALWGIHSYFTASGNNDIVAVVNGSDIQKDQLKFAYQNLRRQMQNQANTSLANNDSALRRQALKTVIDVEVLKQASNDQGFYVSNEQIDSYLQNMPEFQLDGQFSVERFQDVLASSMLNTAEFLELIKTTLLIDQPKLGIIFSAFALPDETNYTVSLVNQERYVEYLKLPLDDFMSRVEKVGQVDIKKYYQNNIKNFMKPEQVSLEYVELSMAELSKQIKPGESELHKYYQDNLNNYTQPKRWRLVDIVIPVTGNDRSKLEKAQKSADQVILALNQDKSFKEVASLYTTGQLSGDTWLSLVQVPGDLQQVVSDLKKSGDVSPAIRTKAGLVVIKALEVREPKVIPYNKVKDRLRDTYIRQQAEEKFADIREQMANIAYEKPESLQPVAKALNLPVRQTELFSKDKAGDGIAEFSNVRKVAFSQEVLVLKNNSDVIQLDPSRVAVVRVKSHVDAAAIPMSSVESEIEKIITRESANKLIADFTRQLTSQLNNGASLESLTKSNKFQWKDLGYIGRYSKEIDPAILDLAFRIPKPGKKPAYGYIQLPDGNYVIVLVKSVRDGKIANKKQYNIFAEQVQNSDGLLEYELYRQSQIENADIRVYEQQ